MLLEKGSPMLLDLSTEMLSVVVAKDSKSYKLHS
jgi:hypothetical protein